jgi:hypothetical protein
MIRYACGCPIESQDDIENATCKDCTNATEASHLFYYRLHNSTIALLVKALEEIRDRDSCSREIRDIIELTLEKM